MKTVSEGRLFFLTDASDRAIVPFSIYLTVKFDNVNTQEAVALSLRLLHRFLSAHRIDLASRALEGRCLSEVECNWLADAAYRPLEELEAMSDAMLRRISSARVASKTAKRAMDAKNSLAPNTAKGRLLAIANFLRWYRTALIDTAIRSPALRTQLEEQYQTTAANLTSSIRGTNSSHASKIKSFPPSRFKLILREAVLRPERIFSTATGSKANSVLRDRVIFLLLAEGLRPGAVANLTVSDFIEADEEGVGYIRLKDNLLRRGTEISAGTPQQKGMRSTAVKYNSDLVLKIWPFTCHAINEYINTERAAVIGRGLKNRSKSFLILGEHGKPIGDRTTINKIMEKVEGNLKRQGLLDVSNDPYMENKKTYDFFPYVLRHSSATYFYKEKRRTTANNETCDLMRQRFGWTEKSSMPTIYANRGLMDAANVDMSDLYADLLEDLKKSKTQDKNDQH